MFQFSSRFAFYKLFVSLTEFLSKAWTKNSINRLLVKFRTVDIQASRQRQTQCTYWWKRRHSWVAVAESGRQTSEPPNSFTWGGGIRRSSVSQIIYKDLRLKCYRKRRAQQLTEAHSMHALFSVCSLRDDNFITSKPTWKLKHAYSRVFWIFRPNITIDIYNFELYRFKVWSF